MKFFTLCTLLSLLAVLPFDLYAQNAQQPAADPDSGRIADSIPKSLQQSDGNFAFYKDPFESYLPKVSETGETIQAKQGDLGPPPITIEGVLWGNTKPMAIIDGEVYGVGDTLLTVGAKVFKIKENTVFISYGERIYEMSVKTNIGTNTNDETKGVQ